LTAVTSKRSVRTEIEEAVATVIVDNPPVNSLDNETLDALGHVAERCGNDPSIRAIVLTGAGRRAFMAGADISAFASAFDSPGWIEKHTSISGRVFQAWAALPQPIVAAVQASAVGGGLEIALLCDLVVADPNARFGMPEVTLGLIPGAGGTQRLPRRMPEAAARELLLLGSMIGADRALELGLVTRIARPGKALAEACELAARLASLPARAVQAVKRAVVSSNDIDHGLERERALFLEVFGTRDAREGVSAFLEKRPPMFEHG
jgi:enoyl-CoA hydratase/carnithine racemase